MWLDAMLLFQAMSAAPILPTDRHCACCKFLYCIVLCSLFVTLCIVEFSVGLGVGSCTVMPLAGVFLFFIWRALGYLTATTVRAVRAHTDSRPTVRRSKSRSEEF